MNNIIIETKSDVPSTSASLNRVELKLKGANPKAQDKVAQVLKAVELSSDNLTVMVLCRLLEGYVTAGSKCVRLRRLRQMVRLDAANHLFRAVRAHCQTAEPTPFAIVANDQLMTTVTRIAAKDPKFMLKVRIAGLLQDLCARVLEVDRMHCTITLLRFTCRSLKSPRNSQQMGRDRQFAQRFTHVLADFNAIECAAGEGATGSFAAESARAQNPDAFTAADKMARLVEVLFYVTKNRKNKLNLIDQGVISVLKTVFETHFQRRFVDPVHSEIALIATAVLRHLSKTRRGRDALNALNVLQMCESCVQRLSDDRPALAHRRPLLANCTQLQDSLCALCIRCLPQLAFPGNNRPFPAAFRPPEEPHPTLRGRNASFNRTPTKTAGSLGPGTTPGTAASADAAPMPPDLPDSEDEDAADEEEESFMDFMKSEDAQILGSASLAAEDGVVFFHSDDENPKEEEEEGADSQALPKCTKQKPAELKANYSPLFAELEQGAAPSTVQSPKLRRTNQGAVPAADPSTTSATTSAPRPTLEIHSGCLQRHAQQTKSVARFVKIAYPDLADPDVETDRKDLLANQESMRETVIQKLQKLRNNSANGAVGEGGDRQQQEQQPRVVYDLDQLYRTQSAPPGPLRNDDAARCGQPHAVDEAAEEEDDQLRFESRFESGNLRQAIRVARHHYEMVLSPDINETRAHYQWFYFEVSNNRADTPYTFEIINCLKNTSMFSKGMQPVLFSVQEALNGRPGWVRCGQTVCYYRNLYMQPQQQQQTEPDEPNENERRRTQSLNGTTPTKPTRTPSKQTDPDKEKDKNYFSMRFTVRFRHASDVSYIAYHFPYTYSYLQATLERHLSNSAHTPHLYLRVDRLTQTLAGNPVPLITITANGTADQVKTRQMVLFTARVHPGESNSSWIMHGVLRALLADTPAAQQLRERFVFKLVPMLNPDGVVNGSHRCSLAGLDLNRVWDRPSAHRHPTVYHTKGLVQYMVEVAQRAPLCFVDVHGHSRKSNVFCYGNNPEESWRAADRAQPAPPAHAALPDLLDKRADGFALKDCRFQITKAKEGSARVSLWRQFDLPRCYTMESTYCGFDQGPHQGKQIAIQDLKRMGECLCEVMPALEDAVKAGQPPLGPTSFVGLKLDAANKRRPSIPLNKVSPQLSMPGGAAHPDFGHSAKAKSPKRQSISGGIQATTAATQQQQQPAKKLVKQSKSTQQ